MLHSDQGQAPFGAGQANSVPVSRHDVRHNFFAPTELWLFPNLAALPSTANPYARPHSATLRPPIADYMT